MAVSPFVAAVEAGHLVAMLACDGPSALGEDERFPSFVGAHRTVASGFGLVELASFSLEVVVGGYQRGDGNQRGSNDEVMHCGAPS